MIVSDIKCKVVFAGLYCLSLACIHIMGVSSVNRYRAYNGRQHFKQEIRMFNLVIKNGNVIIESPFF